VFPPAADMRKPMTVITAATAIAVVAPAITMSRRARAITAATAWGEFSGVPLLDS